MYSGNSASVRRVGAGDEFMGNGRVAVPLRAKLREHVVQNGIVESQSTRGPAPDEATHFNAIAINRPVGSLAPSTMYSVPPPEIANIPGVG